MMAVKAAACFLVLTLAAGVYGQLSLTVGPEVLWDTNSGEHDVVAGSVIQLLCSATGTTPEGVTWTRDGIQLRNDPPHVRVRVSSGGDGATLSMVTVDKFNSADDGSYVCVTNEIRSSPLNLTASVTSTLELLKQPADNELNRNNMLFGTETNDIISNKRTSIRPDVVNVDPDGTPEDDRLMQCVAKQLDGLATPSVTWIKDGRNLPFVEDPRISVSSVSTGDQTMSFLRILNFSSTDTGVYQCICASAGGSRAVVTSLPYRLDYGEELFLEGVTPNVVILNPPEKLVLEVETAGGYQRINWIRNGIAYSIDPNSPFPATSERFINFWTTYVREPTGSDDLGLYRVELVQFGSQNTVNANRLQFSVFPYVPPHTTASLSTVTVRQGETAILSCSSVGTPPPAIIWRRDGVDVPFPWTNEATNPAIDQQAYVAMEGRSLSTLQIANTAYPSSVGVYECVGSNEHGGVMRNSSDFVTLDVQVAPEVTMVAEPHHNVLLGWPVTISCTVSRANPSAVSYTWTFVNRQGETTVFLIADKLALNHVQAANYGTYFCAVSNTVGTGKANITIGEGVKPLAVQTSLTEVVSFVGARLSLSVDVTVFNMPIEVRWTHSGVELTNATERVTVFHTGLKEAPARSILVVEALEGDDGGSYLATAANPAGESTVEFEVSVYGTTGALFQLRFILNLTDTQDSCSSLVAMKEDALTADIISTVVDAVRTECQCYFGKENIRNKKLSCGGSQEVIIFQAQIVQTALAGRAEELVSDISTWVDKGVTFDLHGVMATVDRTCKTDLAFFSSEVCGESSESSDSDSEESSDFLDSWLARVLLGMCCLLLVIMCLMVVGVVVMSVRTRRRAKLRLSARAKLELHDYPPPVVPPMQSPWKHTSHGYPNTVVSTPPTASGMTYHVYPAATDSTHLNVDNTRVEGEVKTENTYDTPADCTIHFSASPSPALSARPLTPMPTSSSSEGYYCVPRAAILSSRCKGGGDFVDVDEHVPDDYDNPCSILDPH